MKTYLYRASNLKSSIKFEVYHHFGRLLKSVVSCDLFIIIVILIIIIFIIINFFKWVSQSVLKRSYILETLLPEECAFIIGFIVLCALK